MRPNWDPRGRINGLRGVRRKVAILMTALSIGFVAATSFLGFSYSGIDACVMSSIDSLAPLFPPIADGKQVTLREAMRSATFPVLLTPASETEISGVRAVVQPTCSAREPQRGLGPRVRTGTLYLYGGTRLSELEDIAQAMLQRPAAFHH